MSYFIEGDLIARMAEMVVKRRRPEDSALALIDEMFKNISITDMEFNDEEDMPGHPFGDLLAEAFSPGKDWSALKSEDDDEQRQATEEWYDVVWQKFRERIGLS